MTLPALSVSCDCCHRTGAHLTIDCLLSGDPISQCWECFDHRAVPIGHVFATAKAMGWENVPVVIRRSVRVYSFERYMPVSVWIKTIKQIRKAKAKARERQEKRQRDWADPLVDEMRGAWRRSSATRIHVKMPTEQRGFFNRLLRGNG